jgi:capsular polysaccharide biosynthesis protein
MELNDYLKIVKKRAGLIALIVTLSCICAGYLASYMSHPIFTAYTKIVVNKVDIKNGLQQIDQGVITANIMLINSYKEIIKTTPILERVVIEYPNLQTSVNELQGKVQVSAVPNSQVMTITMDDTSYNRALGIVNAVSKVFKNEIPNIMMVDNLVILEDAADKNPPAAKKTSIVLVVLTAFVASFSVSVLLVFLMDYFDNTLREETDIEAILGIPVLVSIKEANKSKLKNVKLSPTTIKAGDPINATLSR